MKVALSVVVVVVMLAASILGSYALSLHALDSSQSHWCQTLTLLTSRPVPRPTDPNANPSRENAYVFYTHLKELERNFGC